MWVVAPRLLSLSSASEQPQSKMLGSSSERSEMTAAAEWGGAAGAVESGSSPQVTSTQHVALRT